MTVWNQQSSPRRGVKPKVWPIQSQHLACICIEFHFPGKIDSEVCLKYPVVCDNKKRIERDDLLFYDSNLSVRFQFACASAVYYSSDTNKSICQSSLPGKERIK